MDYFRDLGERIDSEWQRFDYGESSLPSIAREALADRPPHRHVDPAEIARWLMRQESLPRQLDAALRFGEPPLTVFATPQFHIDVYFWRDTSPLIHDHPFAGVFCVISGCSVHAVYTFEERDRVNERFKIGAIDLETCELIRPGETRLFPPERPLIHRLLHTDSPSLSMVIRTPHRVRPYYYFFDLPGLAVDMAPEPDFALSARKRALFRHLRHTGAQGYDQLLDEFLAHSDFESVYRLIHDLYLECDKLTDLDPIIERTRSAHGSRADMLRPVFENKLREAQLESLRGELSDSPSRFALSLLLIAPERDRLFELLHDRYPEQGATGILVETMRRLAQVEDGVALAPEFADLEFTDRSVEVVASLLDAASPANDPEADRIRSAFLESPITAPLFAERLR